MKKVYITIGFIFLNAACFSQKDSSAVQWLMKPFPKVDSSQIKLFPNPARDNVFVTIKNWDNKFRYTLMLKDGKGRPVKNLIMHQPQQLIPLKASYGKGLLWIEVWKDKELLGLERLSVR